MTKEELIEALARSRHDACRVGWTESSHEPSDFLMSQYRKQTERDWPLIVKFVETWIREHGDPDYLADAWMDDMGTREVMAAIREMGS